MASQEIQQALEAQTKVIAEKQESVRNDLAQVEPAVIEAQQGTEELQWLNMKCDQHGLQHVTRNINLKDELKVRQLSQEVCSKS